MMLRSPDGMVRVCQLQTLQPLSSKLSSASLLKKSGVCAILHMYIQSGVGVVEQCGVYMNTVTDVRIHT